MTLKKQLLLLLLAFPFCGCNNEGAKPLPAVEVKTPPPFEQTVIGKDNPVENRLSGKEILFGSGSITKTQTVYYLIGEDGRSCEVDAGTWYRTKIGDKSSCPDWKSR